MTDKYYEKNKNKILKKHKEYKAKNKEKISEQGKKYYAKNKERIAERRKEYRKVNKERIAERKKLYYAKNKERIAERRKLYYAKNKDRIEEREKGYREANKERIAERKKKYREANKEKIIAKLDREKLREYAKKYRKKNKEMLKIKDKNRLPKRIERIRERYKTDVRFQIKKKIQGYFKYCLDVYTETGKIQNMKKYGVDIKAIVEHLGNPPQDGRKYHIDHIFPVSAFDLNNPDHIKICWHPDNLQWLEASENMSKGDKYDLNEFQEYIKRWNDES